VEEIDWTRREDGRSSLEMSLSKDIREAISLKLVSRGLGLIEMVRTDLDLENTFLRLMQTQEKPA
jgi:hypothetical protein